MNALLSKQNKGPTPVQGEECYSGVAPTPVPFAFLQSTGSSRGQEKHQRGCQLLGSLALFQLEAMLGERQQGGETEKPQKKKCTCMCPFDT